MERRQQLLRKKSPPRKCRHVPRFYRYALCFQSNVHITCCSIYITASISINDIPLVSLILQKLLDATSKEMSPIRTPGFPRGALFTPGGGPPRLGMLAQIAARRASSPSSPSAAAAVVVGAGTTGTTTGGATQARSDDCELAVSAASAGPEPEAAAAPVGDQPSKGLGPITDATAAPTPSLDANSPPDTCGTGTGTVLVRGRSEQPPRSLAAAQKKKKTISDASSATEDCDKENGAARLNIPTSGTPIFPRTQSHSVVSNAIQLTY